MMNTMKRQRGAALIFVMLLVLILGAVLGLSMQLFDLRWLQISRGQTQAQAQQYLLGGEALALRMLLRQAEQDTTHLGQLWARSDSLLPVEGGQIQGRIQDRQSCFNLNGLLFGRGKDSAGNASTEQTPVMQQFLQLASRSGLDMSTAEQLLARLVDWLDADSTLVNADGAESPDYLRLTPPRYSADQPLVDLAEMRQWDGVEGVSQLLAQRWFCVLPTTDQPGLNLNTLTEADAPLLAAMFFNQMDDSQAADLISARPSSGYKDSDEFWKVLGSRVALSGTQKTLLQQQLSVRSYWFEIDVQVQLEGRAARQRSLVWVPRNRSAQVYRRWRGEF